MTPPLQDRGANDATPPSRALVVGVASVLVIGVAAGALWLLGGRGDGHDSGEQPAALASPAAMGGASRFDADPPAPRTDGAAAELPTQAATAKIAPLAKGPDAVPEEWRDIRGSVVRASDGSGVASATVIAVQRDVAANGLTERARVRADADGKFVLHMPSDIQSFRVLAPGLDRARDASRPGADAAVNVEWENGDPTGSSVQLVLDSGWQIDVCVVDGAGNPHAGVVASCAGRTATTGADGRCVLADLPRSDKPVTLTLKPAHDGPSVTQLVAAPDAGGLRQGVKLTVP